MVIPEGMRITSGTIALRSQVEIHLEKGAVIEAGRDRTHYTDEATPALLEACNAEEISITGRGTIEGRGGEFMERYLGHIYEPKPFRPRLLCFYDCERVALRDVTFHDSPHWTVHLIGCRTLSRVCTLPGSMA